MTKINPRYLLIVGAAVAAGAVFDHAFNSYSNSATVRDNGGAVSQPLVANKAVPEPESKTVVPLKPETPATASPAKSLNTILAERDPRQRAKDLQAFVNGLTRSDFADALKRIQRIPGNNERELASRLLVARWVQDDPEAALNFATSNHGYEYVADDAFESLASVDLQGALDRAKAIPESNLREECSVSWQKAIRLLR